MDRAGESGARGTSLEAPRSAHREIVKICDAQIELRAKKAKTKCRTRP